MPSNWLYVDTNFPTFTSGESPNKKIGVIQNYLYMLVEQLRYTLHNLDGSNMNAPALERFTGSITDPINAKIKDSDGNIAKLQVTAEGLSTKISDAEGKISSLEQTVDGFELSATDDGTTTTLTLTSKGISISTTMSSVLAAEREARSAQGMAQRIADGEFKGTFINGTTIYSPSIYAGSASEPGGQIVGIDSHGINIYNGSGKAILRIMEKGGDAWLRSLYNNLYFTCEDRLSISAPDIRFSGGKIGFSEGEKIDFSGARVENLTVYFS